MKFLKNLLQTHKNMEPQTVHQIGKLFFIIFGTRCHIRSQMYITGYCENFYYWY